MDLNVIPDALRYQGKWNEMRIWRASLIFMIFTCTVDSVAVCKSDINALTSRVTFTCPKPSCTQG